MSPSKLESMFTIPKNDNRKTFGGDENLPSLPLPELRHTLSRYLDSLKPFVSVEEYSKSVHLVQNFERGVGRRLHEKLKKKAQKERNWLDKWWEEKAYLEVRLPLLPYCSMDGILPKLVSTWSYGTENDQIKHASVFSYYLTQYWMLIRNEKLVPTQTADKKTVFSMSQYRRLFNTARIPGDSIDSIVCYFKTAAEGSCPSTVIVICRGRLFSVNSLNPNGSPKNPLEWEEILERIISECKESKNNLAPAIMTCDFRTNWSQNRKHLEALSTHNKETLELIDKSVFVLVLDDASPETESEVTNTDLCGDYNNRWCDKSMAMIFYKNGRCGSLCDHSAFDGIVVISCLHYVVTAIEETKQQWSIDPVKLSAPEFKELNFDLDDKLAGEIQRLRIDTLEQRREVLITRHVFEDYGKSEIQRLKFHPDAYVQMCLQAAYFNIHRRPAPCYETATTRKFYKGRTETLRCCTTQCLDWVVSMFDSERSNEDRRFLFERAISRHNELMNEARENAGCDRHLFGMHCLALEEGIPIPELYLDSSYVKSGGGGNFVLSTSCIGYTPLGGGVGPMCKNGYGIFYNLTPNRISFTVSVNTNSDETDAEKFFQSLKNVFRRTRQMLLTGKNISKF